MFEMLKKGVLFTLVAACTVSVANGQVINEFQADPDATNGDANGDGSVSTTQDEFVEIVNNTGSDIDMSNWELHDGFGQRHVFGSGTILADNCAIVVFGGGTPTGAFGGALVTTASGGSLGLNNGGDTITLFSDAGITTVATVTYGSEGGNNQSVTRDPDLTGAFVQHSGATGSGGALFSPGTQIDGTSFGGTCTAPASGACCTDGTVCEDNVNEGDCMGAGQVFTADTLCDDLGTPCVPTNDECADRITISDGTTFVDNAGANNSSDEAGCTVGNDLYYNYTASCTGTLTISACQADSNQAIAVYDGTACPVTASDLLGCDDNNNGGGASCGGDEGPFIQVGVTMGNMYKIRIGHWSNNTSFENLASGVVTLSCSGEAFGACCTDGNVCADGIAESACMGGNQVFTADTLCADLDPACQSGELVINEFQADPASDITGDANGDGTRDGSEDEFVELVNVSGGDLDISGWQINDAVGLRHTFPAATIVPQDCAIVVFGGGTPTGDFGFAVVQTSSEGFLGLNNGGDTITVLTDGGGTVAEHTYGSEGGNNQSITLNPDISGTYEEHSTADTADNSLFSPGTQIDGTNFAGCTPPVPTVSEWGMIIMSLMLAVAGTLVFRGRTVTANG